MVVAASRDEGRLVTGPLLHLEAEHAAPERERTLDVRHLQMDVPDADARIDAHRALDDNGAREAAAPASAQRQ